jgi:hypothetical protein
LLQTFSPKLNGVASDNSEAAPLVLLEGTQTVDDQVAAELLDQPVRIVRRDLQKLIAWRVFRIKLFFSSWKNALAY